MDVFEAVSTVLAVRSYQSKPVPPAVVQKIVEAGRLSASASNRQAWHFVVVENPDTLKKIGQLAKTGPYIAQAPLAIAVAVEPSNYGISDGSRAIQNMILTAWSEGVGSNWVGFVGGLPEVKSLLGIPEQMDLLAILPFGYPAQAVGKGKKNRKPLSEVASRDKYGQPLK